ncbi:MAG: hypothetical protein E7449_04245 [Ruminococcaceae bacterium]|nr:hypothetical protein [Oscillospiraceae bacterium]
MSIEIGMKHTVELTVAPENTAKVVGSGELEVFATPMMAALMEKAAYMAIAPSLPEGDSSVGCELKISHVSATPVGMTVRAEAEVTAVEGKMIHYSVKAYDERGLIGEGTHVRALVHSDRFLERTNNK